MKRAAKTGGRRRFLQGGAALALSGLIGGCDDKGSEPQSPVNFTPGQTLPWINWAGNQSCFPRVRAAPANEDELVDALRNAQGVVRAVGASHSFSAVVPTKDTLVATDFLSGVIGHDPTTHQAEIWAGTRMHMLGPMLEEIGQALPNQPDMDYPAMGGAIANSVHATGTGFGSMSSYVVGLTLATPSGELIECSADRHPQIFQAARASVGALGIVSRLKLQNLPSYRLVEINRVEKTDEVLEDLDARCARHRHFEFLPIPHSSLCATVSTDLDTGDKTPSGAEDPQAALDLRRVFQAISWLPVLQEESFDRILTLALGDKASEIRVGPSYEVFPHMREVRFREMEYTVPADAGPACLREILQTIRQRKLPVCFPLEYRRVRADDIWLSMFEGRDGVTISAHQFGDIDYRPYFAEIEPIFWKYDGRPHWGKIHTLGADRLAALYSRHWQDFHEVRRALDPTRKMMNEHLTHIFGD